MLFSSLTFLFAFLPLTIGLYFLAKDKFKNYILLMASLIFYAWGEPKYIFLMIASIVFNYVAARLIGRCKKKQSRKKKLYLILTIIVNIGVLFIFKYLNFAVDNINTAFGFNLNSPDLVLPIGISFYTFQILSYVIDVYRGRVGVQKNIFTLGTYIALFPQLIAGPIVRYASIEKQLNKRKHSLERFCDGFRRFIVGFSKKVLIANNVAIVADAVFNSPTDIALNPWIIIMGLLAYSLQIYYDFSGYSDMAIGLGKIFGFDFDENFNYPYAATSITDFWRRWHISLTTWFRDYLYIPLGGNRCSKIKWIRNFFIVWLLTGLWHGASWNFILWGLFYAVILLIEKQFLGRYLKKLPRIIAWALTFIVVNIGWLLFRVENLGDLKYVISSLVHPQGSLAEFLSSHFFITPSITFVLIGLLVMFPIWKKIGQRFAARPFGRAVMDIGLIILLVIGVLALVSSAYNPFIYFRF